MATIIFDIERIIDPQVPPKSGVKQQIELNFRAHAEILSVRCLVTTLSQQTVMDQAARLKDSLWVDAKIQGDRFVFATSDSTRERTLAMRVTFASGDIRTYFAPFTPSDAAVERLSIDLDTADESGIVAARRD